MLIKISSLGRGKKKTAKIYMGKNVIKAFLEHGQVTQSVMSPHRSLCSPPHPNQGDVPIYSSSPN